MRFHSHIFLQPKGKDRQKRAGGIVQVCYESLASPVVCLHDTIVA
jgi:hypothetical protein